MFEEIERARKMAEEKHSRQKKEDEQRMKDEEAKAVASYKGALVECDICAEDRPPNRMASCNSRDKHTYCFVCVKTHIETLVGDGKHAPVCMEADCKGSYPHQVLEQLLDKALVARMERLQQNADLKGIEGIEECPFCNFKAICETSSQFDCQNPECLMSSCLNCKAETHSGLSCAAYARKKTENDGGDRGMRLRHLVEEAMSEAMMRRCPECSTPFTKDEGCNKMICPTCGMMSCYVCGAPHINAMHFGLQGCPQFDATEARHDAEVKQAEKDAKEKVKRENPGITDEDLKFAMSDKVKQDDKVRIEREHRALRGEAWDFGMPIEGDAEDPGEGMFDIAEMMGMMGPLGNRREPRVRRPFGPFEIQAWDDPWDEGFNFDGRFGGGMLGRRVAFNDDHLDGRFDDFAPPRRRHRRQGQQDLGRPQIEQTRINVLQQQERMFDQATRNQARIPRAAENRHRPAAEETNTEPDRLVVPRGPTVGAQRLGRTPNTEVGRAAARARPRRGN